MKSHVLTKYNNFSLGFTFGQNLNKFDPPKKILHCRTEAIEIYEIKCDFIWSLNSLWECSFFKEGLHTSRCDDGVTASWKTRSFTIFYCKSVTASAFFSIYLLYATLQSFFLFLFHLCSLQSIFFSFFNAKICRKLNSI